MPGKLPQAVYRIDRPLGVKGADAAALGWALGTYRFGRYRKHDGSFPTLVWPDDCDRADVERAASATFLVRNLINTPADDMGPEEVAAAAKSVAERHGAQFSVIVGDELKTRNYPAVHAIGRACSRAPRLIDLRWGDESAPKVTLVGKGVCFDSGGLDIKMAAGMNQFIYDGVVAAESASVEVRINFDATLLEGKMSDAEIKQLKLGMKMFEHARFVIEAKRVGEC